MGRKKSNQKTEVAVIGAGPGGYVAALRLADLGKKVLLIEERKRPGGTCLLEGCIPSKVLINVVELSETAKNARKIGINFSNMKLNLKMLRQWSETVVDNLSTGIKRLLTHRNIDLIHGHAQFINNKSLALKGNETNIIDFKKCIIATGSRINQLPAAYKKPVWSSAEALKLPFIPKKLLVVGGGYIGLELGLVYAGLGSKVSVAEFFPRLLLGADPDLLKVMVKQIEKRFTEIMVDSKVVDLKKTSTGFSVDIEHNGKTEIKKYDQVLVAVGRKPNTENLNLKNTKIIVNKQGIIQTDLQCRTSEPNIFAIGDVVSGPMLAHKAMREGKIAAEIIARGEADCNNQAIPVAVFTDPEIAWTGLTECEAEDQGIKVNIGRFPLAALGRAWTLGRTEGMVKIISNPENNLILGVGMVGVQASELIAEATLALGLGATIKDLMATIHPHPTISEAIMEAAEVAAGSPIHINPQRKINKRNHVKTEICEESVKKKGG